MCFSVLVVSRGLLHRGISWILGRAKWPSLRKGQRCKFNVFKKNARSSSVVEARPYNRNSLQASVESYSLSSCYLQNFLCYCRLGPVNTYLNVGDVLIWDSRLFRRCHSKVSISKGSSIVGSLFDSLEVVIICNAQCVT